MLLGCQKRAVSPFPEKAAGLYGSHFSHNSEVVAAMQPPRPPLEPAPPDMDVSMSEAVAKHHPNLLLSSSSPAPSVLLLVVTKERRISYANSAAKTRLRLLRGDALESITHSLILTELSANFDKMCTDPQRGVEPFRVMHRDGSPFLCNMEPVFDDHQLTGVAIYLFPQHSTTDALDIEKLYGTMLDSLRQPVLAVDTQGRILYLNHAACSSLGFSPTELRGLDVSKVIYYECTDASMKETEIAKQMFIGGEWRGSVSMRTKLGAQSCIMSVTPLRSPQGFLVGSVRTLELEPFETRPLKVLILFFFFASASRIIRFADFFRFHFIES